MSRTLIAAVIAGVVAACAPTTSAALPSGAAQLILRTQPPPGFSLSHSCPVAGVVPVVVRLDGNELTFASQKANVPVPLVWPAGFSARLLAGRAELVTPFGNVYARDGDVLTNLGGGTLDNGDFNVCFVSPDEYKDAGPSG